MSLFRGLVELLFWGGSAIVAHVYLGYPVWAALLARLRPRPARPDDILPTVTLVVPCYNEAAWIAAKLENSLDLDYPHDLLQIVVVVSGSDDGTAEIAAGYVGPRVELIVEPTRAGKESAMQRAARSASGEILVFTDANAFLNRESVRRMVRWFADPTVGCVAGEKRVSADTGRLAGKGEGSYWQYEGRLKEHESTFGSTMGAVGELMAIRARLMDYPRPDHILEDFALSMRIVKAGYRIVYEPTAIAVEDESPRLSDLFERRARIGAGGLQSVWRLRALLDPRRGLVWWQYVSHRALRWALIPFLLPILLLCNVALLRVRRIYGPTLGGQILLYGMAVLGLACRDTALGRKRVFSFPTFFCIGNAAVLVGAFRLLTGRQTVLWKRTRAVAPTHSSNAIA